MPSSIEWTDESWNPVTGCTRISPGCDHCYMFALYPRLRGMGVPGYETAPDNVRLLPERLQTPLSWKKPRLVFVNSMADVFHPKVPFDFILQMFSVMAEAAAQRGHVFQVLTKRPGRAVEWWKQNQQSFPEGWPPMIWIGTSVESQKYAPRLTVLERLPAIHPAWTSGSRTSSATPVEIDRESERSRGTGRGVHHLSGSAPIVSGFLTERSCHVSDAFP